jgi:hypothetical protein
LLEKLKRGLGGRVDLETAEVANQLEATVVVDAVRRALGRLSVGNALSLVIDDTVVFQDSDGKADDLPDLVLALSEHASIFGRGFKELRFAAEHDEAGLHLVIETRARTRHRHDEPSAIVSVGGRIRSLEPQKGESAESYRARVEPLVKDSVVFETARLSFESFVARLRDALKAELPEMTVEEKRAEARLVKPAERDLTAPEAAPKQPTHPGYDPFAVYYPSPMGMMLDAMLFASFMHMMMPPAIMVMSPLGAPIGSISEVQAQPELASDDHIDRDHDGDHDHADHHHGADDDYADAGSDWDDGGWDGGGWDGGDDLI